MKTKLFLLSALLLVVLNLSKAQTESEPNNTFSTADEVGIGSCIKADLNSYDDEDFFKVIMPKDGVLKMMFVNVPSGGWLETFFYDGGQSIVRYERTAKAGDNLRVEAVLAKGIYYLRVNDYTNGTKIQGDFNICFDFDSSDSKEFNNSFASAAIIPLDTCFMAKIRGYNSQAGGSLGEDVDFYKFTMTKDGVVSVDITQVPQKARLVARFYDIDLKALPAGIGVPGLGLNFNAVLPKGDYYLKIEDYNGKTDSNAYSVCISYDGSDGFEFNNLVAKAAQIKPDSCFEAKIKGYEFINGVHYTDRDIYSFRMVQGGTVTAALPLVPSKLEMQLSLFDSAQLLIKYVNGTEGLPVSLSEYLCPGLYYLMVNDNVQDEESNEVYRLCFNMDKDEECSNSFSTSLAMNICDTVFASLKKAGDKDYFRFTGNGKNVTAKLANIAANITGKLTVYDSNLKQTGSATSIALGKDVLLNIGITTYGDTYYILIESANNATSNSLYRFSVMDDNCKSQNPTTGISEALANKSFTIYPNPSTGQFFVAGDATGEIIIHNGMGQIMYQSIIEKSAVITLPAGIYYATLKTNGITTFQKLTVIH